MSDCEAQYLVDERSPLVSLTAKWAAARLPQIDPGAEPVTADHPVLLADATKHVNDSLRGLFLTMAHSLQYTNRPSFDMTPRVGQSPIDEAFLFRVGIAEPDRPAALVALHSCLQGWAAQGLPLAGGAKITQGPDGEVLLYATSTPIQRAVRTSPRARVYKPGAVAQ
jgi:hypothetical protein